MARPVLVLTVLAISALPVLAAEPIKIDQAAVVRAVVDCRKIADGAERLACYDAAVPKMEAAQATGELITVDKEQRSQIRRQTFGLTLPSLSMFEKGSKTEELTVQTFKVDAAGLGADGKLVITLEDGQVWRQIDNNTVFKTPHPGSVAVIRKAALGSFMMKIDGQQAIRVHRDR